MCGEIFLNTASLCIVLNSPEEPSWLPASLSREATPSLFPPGTAWVETVKVRGGFSLSSTDLGELKSAQVDEEQQDASETLCLLFELV